MADILKTATRLLGKLEKEQAKINGSVDKISKVILTPSAVIGGYKMIQKLKKQKRLFMDTSAILGDRIKLFNDEISKIRGENPSKK